MYYLNYFFIFSIIGHLYESIYYVIMDMKAKSGFLYGYWTPIYGVGAVLIIYISKKVFKNLKVNKFVELLLFLVIMFFILTLIEFISGYTLRFIFHKDFWNYKDYKYNLGKYISLEVSGIWLVFTLIFLYLIKPWMDKVILKIPKVITYILLVLFIIDLICTLIFKNKLI